MFQWSQIATQEEEEVGCLKSRELGERNEVSE